MSTPPPPPPSVTGPVTITDFVRYQGASGDMNPIHHDAGFATAAGFPGPFAPGMYAAGLLATWAAAWLGPDNIRRYKARFLDLVWPGDVLTCSGFLVSGTRTAGIDQLDVELTCTRQTGTIAVQGWATFLAPF